MNVPLACLGVILLAASEQLKRAGAGSDLDIWISNACWGNRICYNHDLERPTSWTEIFGPSPWLVLSSRSSILVLRLALLYTHASALGEDGIHVPINGCHVVT
jgi:hypothetical protein